MNGEKNILVHHELVDEVLIEIMVELVDMVEVLDEMLIADTTQCDVVDEVVDEVVDDTLNETDEMVEHHDMQYIMYVDSQTDETDEMVEYGEKVENDDDLEQHYIIIVHSDIGIIMVEMVETDIQVEIDEDEMICYVMHTEIDEMVEDE